MKNNIIILAALVFAILCSLFFVFYSVGSQPKLVDENKQPIYSDDNPVADNTQTNVPKKDEAVPEVEEPKKEIKKISFLAVGDNLIHSSLYSDAKTLAGDSGKEYDFVPMYENLRSDFEKADLAFVNQEGPIGGKELGYSGYPNFNAPDEAGDALCEVGFDIINLANNHMLDKGEAGYAGTIEYWDKKTEVTSIGGYRNFEDYDDFDIIEKNGLKIALISFTYSTNGMTIPKSSEYHVPLYSEEEVARLSKKARESADVVIASIHWGDEDNFNANDEQKKYAKIFADCNVDVVLGHHSHVLGPIEWLERPDGGKTLVEYSLGNLLSGMMYSRNMLGGMLTFDIVKDGEEPVKIENVLLTPTMCHYNNSVRAFKLYRFSEYPEELIEKHGCNKFESIMSMKYLKGIVTKTISSEFLPSEYKE